MATLKYNSNITRGATHDRIFNLLRLQCHDRTFIFSTKSSTSMIELLKIQSFLSIQMIQIAACQINQKPLLTFLGLTSFDQHKKCTNKFGGVTNDLKPIQHLQPRLWNGIAVQKKVSWCLFHSTAKNTIHRCIHIQHLSEPLVMIASVLLGKKGRLVVS